MTFTTFCRSVLLTAQCTYINLLPNNLKIKEISACGKVHNHPISIHRQRGQEPKDKSIQYYPTYQRPIISGPSLATESVLWAGVNCADRTNRQHSAKEMKGQKACGSVPEPQTIGKKIRTKQHTSCGMGQLCMGLVVVRVTDRRDDSCVPLITGRDIAGGINRKCNRHDHCADHCCPSLNSPRHPVTFRLRITIVDETICRENGLGLGALAKTTPWNGAPNHVQPPPPGVCHAFATVLHPYHRLA